MAAAAEPGDHSAARRAFGRCREGGHLDNFDFQGNVSFNNGILSGSYHTNILVGDSRAAYLELGWRHTVDFDSMAGVMVRHDMALLEDPDALWQIP